LTISYANGVIVWKASSYPEAAAGTKVSLFIDGKLVSTATATGTCTALATDSAQSAPSVGSASAVHASTILAGAQLLLCLVPGTHEAVAVDPGFADTNAVTFSAPTAQTCAASLSTSSTGTGTGVVTATAAPAASGTGALAFTGANVARLAVLALCAIAVGAVVTRAARRRRWS
jgi:hypothetical protein